MAQPLLEIRDLTVRFDTKEGGFTALDDINFAVNEGEAVAMIGESGCGKSVLAHSCLGLLSDVAKTGGKVVLKGKDVFTLSPRELDRVRCREIGLVPQSPSTSFNPVRTIGKQMMEVLRHSGAGNRKDAEQKALESLARVGFKDPKSIFDNYPHRLSGGMNERALIALSLTLNPSILILDEPTKGLDYFSKKVVMETVTRAARGKTLLIITHDFFAVTICDRVFVMYSGQIVEGGKTANILEAPMHPYTRGLLSAVPKGGGMPIPGRHTLEDHLGPGCRFKPRCSKADTVCSAMPELLYKNDGRVVRCHHA
jgi:peptide/nickel transport system ATP-binding protein